MQLKPLSFVPPKLKLDQTLERLVHGKERSLWSTIVILHGCHVVCDRPGVGGDLQISCRTSAAAGAGRPSTRDPMFCIYDKKFVWVLFLPLFEHRILGCASLYVIAYRTGLKKTLDCIEQTGMAQKKIKKFCCVTASGNKGKIKKSTKYCQSLMPVVCY